MGQAAATRCPGPVDEVMGNSDLVGEIIRMVEFRSSRSMIECSAFCSSWLRAARSPDFVRRFVAGHMPSSLGFLMEFISPFDGERVVRLLFADPSEEESAEALRPVIDYEVLALDNILCCQDGVVLSVVPEEISQSTNVYFTSCPCHKTDGVRVYTPVASRIPPILRDPAYHSANTYGQFGVLRGAGNSAMSFFVKNPDNPWRRFNSTHKGVSFASTDNVFVHVCIHDQGVWTRTVSNPYASPVSAMFHRHPYSVIAGNKLYMMYVLGYIVCMDLGSLLFSKIALPSAINFKSRSWLDYTVAADNSGGIVIVNYCKYKLYKWVLSLNGDSDVWTVSAMVNLVEKFHSRIPWCCWERVYTYEDLEDAQDNFYTVQVRKASIDGRFVLLTLGFADCMYEVDFEQQRVREINSCDREGRMGRVFHLSEPWPPRP